MTLIQTGQTQNTDTQVFWTPVKGMDTTEPTNPCYGSGFMTCTPVRSDAATILTGLDKTKLDTIKGLWLVHVSIAVEFGDYTMCECVFGPLPFTSDMRVIHNGQYGLGSPDSGFGILDSGNSNKPTFPNNVTLRADPDTRTADFLFFNWGVVNGENVSGYDRLSYEHDFLVADSK